MGWRGAHLTLRNQVEEGARGALGEVGGLLRELSTGPPSRHCPPSEITSTEEGRKCGPGVTHIWSKPALPCTASPDPTFLQMTETHAGTRGEGLPRAERQAQRGWVAPLASPSSLLPEQASCHENQQQSFTFSSRASPKPQH